MAASLAFPALLVLAAWSQAPAPADGAAGVRVLYPAAGSIQAGPVRVAAAAPLSQTRLPATLDGKPVRLQRMTFAEGWTLPGRLKATAARVGERSATALWVAQAALAPGRHVLVLGQQRLLLTAVPPTERAVISASRSHRLVGAPAAGLDCAGCHEVTGSALGAAPTPKACSLCHDEARVQLIHRHVAEPLSRCAMCHDPHGAALPKLLVAPKDELCRKCHDLGHSKG